MESIRELLRAADPLRREPPLTSGQRDFRRHAVLTAASAVGNPAEVRSRSRIAVLATVGSIAIVAFFLGSLARSPFISDLQAAISLEVRLAEDEPATGLREAKVSGTERLVYLHGEVIVTNSDIAAAQVIQDGAPAQYGVRFEFTASGTEKMLAATANHIGKPVAILIAGQVVVAPVLRTPIGASAVLSGNYTRAQAERIASGIQVH